MLNNKCPIIIYTHQRNDYQIVQAAPTNPAIKAMPRTITCFIHMSSNPARTPFADGGNVVANAMVGFGDPETVTVGDAGSGDGCDPFTVALAARIVNRDEVEYMIPCVEFKKRRK